MPVYNEEKTVGEIVDRVLKQQCVGKLIVLDSSKDRSTEILRKKAKKDRRLCLVHTDTRMQKGEALIRGIKMVKNGRILIQDADLEYFPEEYPALISKAKPGQVVFGSRIIGADVGHRYRLAKIANIVMSTTFSILFGQKITDIYTCYKLFDRKMINPDGLKERSFLIEAEMTIQFVYNGYNIVEVPIRYNGRTFEEGKKIRATDGIKGLLYILKNGLAYALGPKNAS